MKVHSDFRAATDQGIPAAICTCDKEGVPNVTILSKVYWVDDEHVAISFQFFSKTIRNVRENPFVGLRLLDLPKHQSWVLDLEYVRSETEGDVFDEMDMAIQAIASMTGMEGIFKLQAADIYKVHSCRALPWGDE